MREQSQPLGNSLTLIRQAARGFVDRANRFQTEPEGAFLAERWCSGFFNVRRAHLGIAVAAGADDERSPAAQAPGALRESNEAMFTITLETVRGFIDRGGQFVPDEAGDREGDSLGDRWVSGWFNVRSAQTTVAGKQAK
jgi:hypothetical protein